MDSDIIDTEDPADQTTTAAFAAPPFQWKDITLGAFAVDVEADWLLHRRIMGSPPIHQLIADRGACTLDAFRVLWFCAVDDSEWRGKPPSQTDAAIRAWARKNILPEEMPDAVELFLDIFTRSQKTRAVVVGGSDGKKKPSQSRRSRPNTSASSPAPAQVSSSGTASQTAHPSRLTTTSATTSRKSKAGPTSTPGSLSKASKPNGPTNATRRRSGGKASKSSGSKLSDH